MEGRSDLDLVTGAIEIYERSHQAKVRAMTAISALSTMHDDVCHVAEKKRVALAIMPFHKYWRVEDDEEEVVEDVGCEWGWVNQRVLAHAPCSVGLFLDRGFAGSRCTASNNRICGVCVMFFGGSDDREALELGLMMMNSPNIRLTLLRFTTKEEDGGGRSAQEKEKDEEAVAEFRMRSEGQAAYEEKRTGNVVKDVLDVGRSREFELVVAGRGRRSSAVDLGDWCGEHTELGLIGNILASEGHGMVSSILVIQQHGVENSGDQLPPSSTMIRNNLASAPVSVGASV